MTAPIDLLRQACLEQLTAAAQVLDCPLPEQLPLRYRSDGKGGVFASPFPMQAHLDPQTAADACGAHPLVARVAPSGQWLAFTPSEAWYALVGSYLPHPLPLGEVMAPPPFPARVDGLSWSLCVALGKADAALAARLDLENPRFFLKRAYILAKNGRGGNRPCARIVCECALLQQLLEEQDTPGAAQRAMILARLYLEQPCEDALVAGLLACLPWI